MIKEQKQKFKKLKLDWNNFKSDSSNKSVRIRDAANQLSVSEAELLSTKINEGIDYLKIDNYQSFFDQLFKVDKVMLLIRNDVVVHEKVIEANSLIFSNNQILNKEEHNFPISTFNTDLFAHIFFEKKIHQNKTLMSFQFFDYKGDSIIKIYLKGKDEKLFEDIAHSYVIEYNYQLQALDKKNTNQDINNDQIHLQILHNEKYTLNKDCKLDQKLIRIILETASKKKFPIQIHAIGNNAIQYHRGKVKNIMDFGPWINVIDKKFNIHALENQLSKNILSEYLSNDSKHYSIDFFDQSNNYILGISPIKGYSQNFYSLIRELGLIE